MKFELLRTTNDLSRLVMKCDRLSKSRFSRVTNRKEGPQRFGEKRGADQISEGHGQVLNFISVWIP